MLILQRVRQLMCHDYALLVVIDGNPIRHVKLVCFRVVQAGDLLGEQIDHERIEVKPFGKQAEGFGASGSRITLRGVLVVVHFLDDVGANLLPGTQAFFERAAQRQSRDLAHLRKHFVGSCVKISRTGLARWSSRGGVRPPR